MIKRDEGVDFLRGLSILAVVGYHYYFALPVSDFGLYGVFLFFVISGYCMSPSVESSSTATTFLTKRIFRIVPALIVCALITAIIEYLAPINPERGQSWVQVAQSIVCIPSIDLPCILVGRPGYNMVDGAYWSLRVEVKFYVLLALCYFGISKRYYLQTLFCAMAIGAAALYYFPQFDKLPWMPEIYFKDFIPYLPFFIAGMSVHQLKIGGRVAGLVGLAGSFAAILTFFYLGISSYSIPLNFNAVIAFAVSVALICLFVFRYESFERRIIWIAKPVLFLGAISYPLYLLHQDIGYLLISVIGDQWWARIFIVPAIVIAMAYMVHRYIENLLRKRQGIITESSRTHLRA